MVRTDNSHEPPMSLVQSDLGRILGLSGCDLNRSNRPAPILNHPEPSIHTAGLVETVIGTLVFWISSRSLRSSICGIAAKEEHGIEAYGKDESVSLCDVYEVLRFQDRWIQLLSKRVKRHARVDDVSSGPHKKVPDDFIPKHKGNHAK